MEIRISSPQCRRRRKCSKARSRSRIRDRARFLDPDSPDFGYLKREKHHHRHHDDDRGMFNNLRYLCSENDVRGNFGDPDQTQENGHRSAWIDAACDQGQSENLSLQSRSPLPLSAVRATSNRERLSWLRGRSSNNGYNSSRPWDPWHRDYPQGPRYYRESELPPWFGRQQQSFGVNRVVCTRRDREVDRWYDRHPRQYNQQEQDYGRHREYRERVFRQEEDHRHHEFHQEFRNERSSPRSSVAEPPNKWKRDAPTGPTLPRREPLLPTPAVKPVSTVCKEKVASIKKNTEPNSDCFEKPVENVATECDREEAGIELCESAEKDIPVQDSCVASDPLQDSCVASDPLQDSCVASDPLQDSCVASDPLQDSCVASDPLQDSCVLSDSVCQDNTVSSELLTSSDSVIESESGKKSACDDRSHSTALQAIKDVVTDKILLADKKLLSKPFVSVCRLQLDSSSVPEESTMDSEEELQDDRENLNPNLNPENDSTIDLTADSSDDECVEFVSVRMVPVKLRNEIIHRNSRKEKEASDDVSNGEVSTDLKVTKKEEPQEDLDNNNVKNEIKIDSYNDQRNIEQDEIERRVAEVHGDSHLRKTESLLSLLGTLLGPPSLELQVNEGGPSGPCTNDTGTTVVPTTENETPNDATINNDDDTLNQIATNDDTTPTDTTDVDDSANVPTAENESATIETADKSENQIAKETAANTAVNSQRTLSRFKNLRRETETVPKFRAGFRDRRTKSLDCRFVVDYPNILTRRAANLMGLSSDLPRTLQENIAYYRNKEDMVECENDSSEIYSSVPRTEYADKDPRARAKNRSDNTDRQSTNSQSASAENGNRDCSAPVHRGKDQVKYSDRADRNCFLCDGRNVDKADSSKMKQNTNTQPSTSSLSRRRSSCSFEQREHSNDRSQNFQNAKKPELTGANITKRRGSALFQDEEQHKERGRSTREDPVGTQTAKRRSSALFHDEERGRSSRKDPVGIHAAKRRSSALFHDEERGPSSREDPVGTQTAKRRSSALFHDEERGPSSSEDPVGTHAAKRRSSALFEHEDKKRDHVQPKPHPHTSTRPSSPSTSKTAPERSKDFRGDKGGQHSNHKEHRENHKNRNSESTSEKHVSKHHNHKDSEKRHASKRNSTNDETYTKSTKTTNKPTSTHSHSKIKGPPKLPIPGPSLQKSSTVGKQSPVPVPEPVPPVAEKSTNQVQLPEKTQSKLLELFGSLVEDCEKGPPGSTSEDSDVLQNDSGHGANVNSAKRRSSGHADSGCSEDSVSANNDGSKCGKRSKLDTDKSTGNATKDKPGKRKYSRSRDSSEMTDSAKMRKLNGNHSGSPEKSLEKSAWPLLDQPEEAEGKKQVRDMPFLQKTPTKNRNDHGSHQASPSTDPSIESNHQSDHEFSSLPEKSVVNQTVENLNNGNLSSPNESNKESFPETAQASTSSDASEATLPVTIDTQPTPCVTSEPPKDDATARPDSLVDAPRTVTHMSSENYASYLFTYIRLTIHAETGWIWIKHYFSSYMLHLQELHIHESTESAFKAFWTSLTGDIAQEIWNGLNDVIMDGTFEELIELLLEKLRQDAKMKDVNKVKLLRILKLLFDRFDGENSFLGLLQKKIESSLSGDAAGRPGAVRKMDAHQNDDNFQSTVVAAVPAPSQVQTNTDSSPIFKQSSENTQSERLNKIIDQVATGTSSDTLVPSHQTAGEVATASVSSVAAIHQQSSAYSNQTVEQKQQNVVGSVQPSSMNQSNGSITMPCYINREPGLHQAGPPDRSAHVVTASSQQQDAAGPYHRYPNFGPSSSQQQSQNVQSFAVPVNQQSLDKVNKMYNSQLQQRTDNTSKSNQNRIKKPRTACPSTPVMQNPVIPSGFPHNMIQVRAPSQLMHNNSAYRSANNENSAATSTTQFDHARNNQLGDSGMYPMPPLLNIPYNQLRYMSSGTHANVTSPANSTMDQQMLYSLSLNRFRNHLQSKIMSRDMRPVANAPMAPAGMNIRTKSPNQLPVMTSSAQSTVNPQNMSSVYQSRVMNPIAPPSVVNIPTSGAQSIINPHNVTSMYQSRDPYHPPSTSRGKNPVAPAVNMPTRSPNLPWVMTSDAQSTVNPQNMSTVYQSRDMHQTPPAVNLPTRSPNQSHMASYAQSIVNPRHVHSMHQLRDILSNNSAVNIPTKSPNQSGAQSTINPQNMASVYQLRDMHQTPAAVNLPTRSPNQSVAQSTINPQNVLSMNQSRDTYQSAPVVNIPTKSPNQPHLASCGVQSTINPQNVPLIMHQSKDMHPNNSAVNIPTKSSNQSGAQSTINPQNMASVYQSRDMHQTPAAVNLPTRSPNQSVTQSTINPQNVLSMYQSRDTNQSAPVVNIPTKSPNQSHTASGAQTTVNPQNVFSMHQSRDMHPSNSAVNIPTKSLNQSGAQSTINPQNMASVYQSRDMHQTPPAVNVPTRSPNQSVAQSTINPQNVLSMYQSRDTYQSAPVVNIPTKSPNQPHMAACGSQSTINPQNVPSIMHQSKDMHPNNSAVNTPTMSPNQSHLASTSRDMYPIVVNAPQAVNMPSNLPGSLGIPSVAASGETVSSLVNHRNRGLPPSYEQAVIADSTGTTGVPGHRGSETSMPNNDSHKGMRIKVTALRKNHFRRPAMTKHIRRCSTKNDTKEDDSAVSVPVIQPAEVPFKFGAATSSSGTTGTCTSTSAVQDEQPTTTRPSTPELTDRQPENFGSEQLNLSSMSVPALISTFYNSQKNLIIKSATEAGKGDTDTVEKTAKMSVPKSPGSDSDSINTEHNFEFSCAGLTIEIGDVDDDNECKMADRDKQMKAAKEYQSCFENVTDVEDNDNLSEQEEVSSTAESIPSPDTTAAQPNEGTETSPREAPQSDGEGNNEVQEFRYINTNCICGRLPTKMCHCKLAVYCSTRCQQVHRKEHMIVCRWRQPPKN